VNEEIYKNLQKYAELHALSNFTFLGGASHPEELVVQAAKLGYSAIAVTDECSLAGVVRAHVKAREIGIKFLLGSEFRLSEGIRLLLISPNLSAYTALCDLITRGRRGAKKGSYQLRKKDFTSEISSCCAILLSRETTHGRPENELELLKDGRWLRTIFSDNTWIGLDHRADGLDSLRLEQKRRIARTLELRLVYCGNTHIHQRTRQCLQDVVTAIRNNTTVRQSGYQLHPNGEWFLQPIATLYQRLPEELLLETLKIAERCQFSLSELTYEYPQEHIPARSTPYQYLRRLTLQGMHKRWPEGTPDKVQELVRHELKLIRELKYEAYFLTVYDIVCFARSQAILCQGRGSAANSAICYCLGITEVDPARMDLLFERFISRERNEPPDIDVDFEHDRREEVMQYIYNKYGREHAALTATVVTYRPKSAIRDVGKALGFSLDQVSHLSSNLSWWDGNQVIPERLAEANMDISQPAVQQLIKLTAEIIGFPRHLSQHTGGFVISHLPLNHIVPVENASMPDRTIIQWDKNDIDALGLLKVDCLALGMLSAIRRGFDLIEQVTEQHYSMATVPAEDTDTYDMISKADTIGVFQIESRAQMAMLPRLKPRNFYDLVIEVAIVRPGPIQGDMVHPYLKRRQGLEPVVYPSEAVKTILERTLGIPIFQEQVIKLAMVAAGFTPGEADGLRRSMAAWKRRGGIEEYQKKLVKGMVERGYSMEFAERINQQILGFGEYGFPESHAASFSLLVYISAWMKCHHPAVFTCALLNSQPMGFYAPAQLVQDAQRHDVEIRPVDINCSNWDCSLETDISPPAIRLGLRLVKHLSHIGAEQLLEARNSKPYASSADLARRSKMDQKDLNALAAGATLDSISHHRHQATWDLSGAEPDLPLLQDAWPDEPKPMLIAPSVGENVQADYASTGLTLGPHPLALLRQQLDHYRIKTSKRILATPHGALVRVAGIVTSRQRPSSANNVAFVTLEDESGYLNLVVWQRIAEAQRRILTQSRLMAAFGEVQREGDVIHIIVKQLKDFTPMLGEILTRSRDFK
jgi:error-prone DNA polymerase